MGLLDSIFGKPKKGAIELTEENFNELVWDAKLPVIIDFYADWCQPCQVMISLINRLAKEYEGKVLICKANVDYNPKLSQHFEVKSVPTLLFIENNAVEERVSGLIPYPVLIEKTESLILASVEKIEENIE